MSPSRRALLIGIDYYLANNLGYDRLFGAVRDIERVEAFCRRTLNLCDDDITKLTATATSNRVVEEEDKLPTYSNIVAALQQLLADSREGDLAYIHYSGHGGRALTRLPHIKGENALDEGLVPTDIGSLNSDYVRDVELAYYCHEIAKKGAFLTVVLDCCHAGGMSRGKGNARHRGGTGIDTTPRPLARNNLPLELLADRLRHSCDAEYEHKFGRGWLPEPYGYTLLSACRANEYAYECVFEGDHSQGALTYAWLRSLQTSGPRVTYKDVFDRLLPEVLRHFSNQTPQLYGDARRVLFTGQEQHVVFAVPVLRVDTTKSRVHLNAGKVHGVEISTQFAIFPHGTSDFSQTALRKTIVEVDKVDAVEAWATTLESFGGQNILTAGDLAVLIRAPSINLKLPVTVVEDNIRNAIEEAIQASGWLRLQNDEAALQVTINSRNEYEILDAANQPFPHILSPLHIRNIDTVSRLIGRLEHLARYRAIKGLHNYDGTSKVANAVDLKVLGRVNNYVRGSRVVPEPLDKIDGRYFLQDGDILFVQITNHSTQVLNLTAIAIQADWSVAQTHPGDAANSITLERNMPEVLRFGFRLPPHIDDGIDILKFFITVGTTNFRWLELPSMDEQQNRSQHPRRAQNALEQLLEVFTAEKPTRNVLLVAAPCEEWVTLELLIHVHRPTLTAQPKAQVPTLQ